MRMCGHGSTVMARIARERASRVRMRQPCRQAGRRTDPLMSPIAKTLSAADIQALAEYFSKQRPMSSSYATQDAKIAQGRQIASDALCTMCHQGGFSGQNEVPVVAGQQDQYIVKQLRDFRDGRRTNDAGTTLRRPPPGRQPVPDRGTDRLGRRSEVAAGNRARRGEMCPQPVRPKVTSVPARFAQPAGSGAAARMRPAPSHRKRWPGVPEAGRSDPGIGQDSVTAPQPEQ
jgi:cytochrome c553